MFSFSELNDVRAHNSPLSSLSSSAPQSPSMAAALQGAAVFPADGACLARCRDVSLPPADLAWHAVGAAALLPVKLASHATGSHRGPPPPRATSTSQAGEHAPFLAARLPLQPDSISPAPPLLRGVASLHRAHAPPPQQPSGRTSSISSMAERAPPRPPW